MKARLLSTLVCVYALTSSQAAVINYWRFEESSGTYAADSAGVVPGELIGVPSVQWSGNVFGDTVPLTGQPNQHSLRFGGAGYVDITTWDTMDFGTSFTIEFFFNADMPVTASPTFGFEPVNKLFCPLGESGGNLFWRPQFQNHLELIPADLVLLNTWQHFALVKEPGEYSIYVDGVLEYNGALPAGTDGPYIFPGTPATGSRTIGGDTGSFRGWLDEFRISDEALSPNQFLNAIPEPGTVILSLLGIALLGTRGLWKRRR